MVGFYYAWLAFGGNSPDGLIFVEGRKSFWADGARVSAEDGFRPMSSYVELLWGSRIDSIDVPVS